VPVDGRLAKCSWCGILFVVCRGCDRGQHYCCAEHSQKGRQRSLLAAGKRYGQTAGGRRSNCERQARFRNKIHSVRAPEGKDSQKKVTHQGSPNKPCPGRVETCVTQPPHQSIIKEKTLRCSICGDAISGEYLRMDYCRRRSRWYREHGRDRAGSGRGDHSTSRQ
jgi:hypothetical protein